MVVERDDPGPGLAGGSQWLDLEVVGNDHPGIVRDISALLANLGVNVEELRTECVDAPHAGDRLFRATARLLSPGSVAPGELRSRLEALASELMVDVQIRDEGR